MRVLVTGATGFIGSHILEALRSAEIPVAVLVRRASNLAHARAQGVELHFGDLRDVESLRRAVRGCAGVIHAAALASDWGPRREFLEVNVQGTLNVLGACRAEGIRQAIVTGSISSYGEEDSPQAKDESFPFRSHYAYFGHRVFPSGYNRYRDSKAQATQAAVAFGLEHGLDVTVLEPVWVFGEREFGTGFYTYVKAVRDGQRHMPGSTRNRFQVIYAPDLARAYLLALQRRLPGVERIIVGPPRAEPMHKIFGLFCREAGLPPPRLLPKWCVYPLGFGLELLYTAVRRRRPPLLTRGRVNMFYDSIQFSTEKARKLLGFECRHSLDEGIRRTVSWYRNNHLL
jgi:nucleoside-diphosphate-sugar epimerase